MGGGHVARRDQHKTGMIIPQGLVSQKSDKVYFRSHLFFKYTVDYISPFGNT